jgi:hypothetical protein
MLNINRFYMKSEQFQNVAPQLASTFSSFKGDFLARTPELEAPELTAHSSQLTAHS